MATEYTSDSSAVHELKQPNRELLVWPLQQLEHSGSYSRNQTESECTKPKSCCTPLVVVAKALALAAASSAADTPSPSRLVWFSTKARKPMVASDSNNFTIFTKSQLCWKSKECDVMQMICTTHLRIRSWYVYHVHDSKTEGRFPDEIWTDSRNVKVRTAANLKMLST